MEFLIFYILFSWLVVYEVFKTNTDTIGENVTNVIMSLLCGWFVLPMLIGVHLRHDENYLK